MAASLFNIGSDSLANDNAGCNFNNNNYVVNNNYVETVSGKITLNSSSQNLFEMKEKRNTLEQRKQYLEKLLLEKKWLLQQIQKEEAHILQGNYNYIHFNDIFNYLSQQYKLPEQQENLQLAGTDFKVCKNNNTSILRRKSSASTINDENQLEQHINLKIQLPDIAKRSSEYDNFPSIRSLHCDDEAKHVTKLKTANPKKFSPPITAPSNFNKKLLATTTHFDNSTPTGLLKFAPSPRQITREKHRFHQPMQQQNTSHTSDTISLYSINSFNVATLRHQHIAPQQQPIIVQYEKYCLSPTRQTLNDCTFIKSSQDIKRFIPASQQQQLQPTKSQTLGYQQIPEFAQFQTVSLNNNAVGVENVNIGDANDNWKRSHNADSSTSVTSVSNKQLDNISVCSTNSESQKRGLKPKVWLESSLDEPLLRTTGAQNSELMKNNVSPIFEKKISDHSKPSSQSIATGRNNSISGTLQMGSSLGMDDVKSLQDKDSTKLRLTQSSSYLNDLKTMHTAMMPIYKPQTMQKYTFTNQHLPQNISESITPPPPPRSYHTMDKLHTPAAATPPPQDIRIESPKNMKVITQATFQPYKEITKPFEMSDFYKYSTKFRQNDNSNL